MAFAYSPKIVTDGLVFAVDAANKKSYPGSGTTWSDLSGNGNNGTLVNGPTYDGANGGSIVFDGSDDYVGFGNIGPFSSLTLDFWVYPLNFNSGATIISKRDALRVNQDFNLFVFADGRLTIDIGDVRTNVTTIQGNTLYNIVAAYNSLTGDLKVYINNTLITNPTLSTNLIVSNTANTILGRLTGNVYFWDGKMFTGKIYNRALTAPEITQNYNALKGRFVLS